jgi:putative sterol carrier protein
MVDEELKEKMKDKIESNSFETSDVEEYMKLFIQICNENEEIQEEVEGFNRTLHFYIDGGDNFTMIIKNQVGSIKKGIVGDFDATIKISLENFAALISGQKDGQAIYMSGQLEAHGGLPNMIKFQKIANLVLEVVED